MYPNPQDVLPLPPRPDLHHYRKRAKDLVRACDAGGDEAIDAWAERWVGDLAELHRDGEPARQMRDRARYASDVARFARARLHDGCALAAAQFVIARAHGFDSWPKLVHHLEALSGARTPVSSFEEAADAIVAGDLATLDRLLHADPALVRARSSRQHHATLLHYVAANGVENFRQETPANIVEITRLLLDAGAEVNAEADVYGGGATTLGLALTSAHPRLAGVQLALGELLLERGAVIARDSVRSSLMNGCPEAAEYLAQKGAALRLEDAAGIGRVDVVERYMEEGPGLTDLAWRKEVGDALMMAVWYDRVDVVHSLLDRGFDPAWTVRGDGEGRTALHLASYEGRVSIVESLLRRGAPVDVTDDAHGTTPLVWGLHAWLVEGRRDQPSYRAVVRMLAEAGAIVHEEWIDDDRVRADTALFELLRRRAASR